MTRWSRWLLGLCKHRPKKQLQLQDEQILAALRQGVSPWQRNYRLEKGTKEHQLAQESLFLLRNETDYTVFTDNGHVILSVLFEELKESYTKEIKQEQKQRLRGLRP